MPKDYIICWIYPHPVTVANKGLDRFRWIPYQKCDNPGVHCYWLGGRSKSYPGSSILDVQFELWLHKTIVARKMSTPGADGQEPTLKQHGAKDSGNGCGSWITRSMVLFGSLSYIFGMGDDIRFVKKRKKEDKEDTVCTSLNARQRGQQNIYQTIVFYIDLCGFQGFLFSWKKERSFSHSLPCMETNHDWTLPGKVLSWCFAKALEEPGTSSHARFMLYETGDVLWWVKKCQDRPRLNFTGTYFDLQEAININMGVLPHITLYIIAVLIGNSKSDAEHQEFCLTSNGSGQNKLHWISASILKHSVFLDCRAYQKFLKSTTSSITSCRKSYWLFLCLRQMPDIAWCLFFFPGTLSLTVLFLLWVGICRHDFFKGFKLFRPSARSKPRTMKILQPMESLPRT